MKWRPLCIPAALVSGEGELCSMHPAASAASAEEKLALSAMYSFTTIRVKHLLQKQVILLLIMQKYPGQLPQSWLS